MERGEDFSSFRSAIEWPDMRADFDEFVRSDFSSSRANELSGEGPAYRSDRGWWPLGTAVMVVLESAAIAMEVAPHCESPIEIDLAVRLTKALRVIDDPTLSLGHQIKLGRYRCDLAIKREGRPKPLVLIECDGKEFHSTGDRIANDRAKDALAAKEGIFLWRFSGSEIFRNLEFCAYQILKGLRFHAHLTQHDWDALELARMV